MASRPCLSLRRHRQRLGRVRTRTRGGLFRRQPTRPARRHQTGPGHRPPGTSPQAAYLPTRNQGFPQDLLELPSESIPPPRAVDLVLAMATIRNLAGESFSVEPSVEVGKPHLAVGSVADQALPAMDHEPPTSPDWQRSYSAHLEGQHGRRPLWLEAELHFRDGHPFDHATVTESFAGEASSPIQAVNGLSRSDLFAVDGSQGTATFTVYISVNHIPNRAIIRGHVSDNAIHVDAPLTHAGGRHIALAGSPMATAPAASRSRTPLPVPAAIRPFPPARSLLVSPNPASYFVSPRQPDRSYQNIRCLYRRVER